MLAQQEIKCEIGTWRIILFSDFSWELRLKRIDELETTVSSGNVEGGVADSGEFPARVFRAFQLINQQLCQDRRT